MSINKSLLTMLRKGNGMSSLLCDKYNVLCMENRVSTSQRRNITCGETKNYGEKVAAANEKPDWNTAVTEAEKLVNYSTTFLNSRWLLNDEIASFALQMKKLVACNHPLLKTAKTLVYHGRNNLQAWGLVVLLISKAGGHLHVDHTEEEKAAGVLHNQKTLAEVTEMIRTGHLIHNSLVNIESGYHHDGSEQANRALGNKLAILIGDYMLGSTCVDLANLRNQPIIEMMSSTITDFVEAEFIGRHDKDSHPLPSIPPADRTGYAIKEWTLRYLLSSASLLGKSCSCALRLAGHSDDVQAQGYEFGKHLALAWQAGSDLGPFIGKNSTNINLCSAPVMFHIEHDPTILTEIENGLESIENIDYDKVYNAVVKGPGVEKTKQLHEEHSRKAMEILSIFPDNDARAALYNMIAAMRDYKENAKKINIL